MSYRREERNGGPRPCANKSQAFAARWVLRERSSKQGTARFSEECSRLAPPLGRLSIFSGPGEMDPQSSKTVLSMAHSFASGKGREAQSRCQFALGQTPGAWPAERTLPKPQRSNLAQLLAGRGGGGCMQLPVSMCRTCTRHRLTQPELACARKSRNQPSRQAWFSEVRGHGQSQATPLLCHDSAQGAQICHLE